MSSNHENLPRSFHGDRYLLTELIGEGGMARVYRAIDRVLQAPRAVKILRSRGGKTGRNRQVRLLREARAMASVDHPNVVQVYDFGEDDEGAFIVMELVEGGSLADQVQGHGRQGPRQAVDWTLQVLEGLEASHAAGILHRDIKAANVLLDRDGTARLADFGIALVEGEDRFTRTKVSMGSMAYMPPEQRLNARDVDARADVYAAACTLYYLLTASTPVDLFLAEAASPRWLDVPEVLRPVLLRATRAAPEERYPDAKAFREALVAVRSEVPEEPVEVGMVGAQHDGVTRTSDSASWRGSGDAQSTLAAGRTGTAGASTEQRTEATEATEERERTSFLFVYLALCVGITAAAFIPWMHGVLQRGPLEREATTEPASAEVVLPPPAPAVVEPVSTPTPAPPVKTPPAPTPIPVVAAARPRPTPTPAPPRQDVPPEWAAVCPGASGPRADDVRGCWEVASWFGVPAWLLIEGDLAGPLGSRLWQRTAKGAWMVRTGQVSQREGQWVLIESDVLRGYEIALSAEAPGLLRAKGRGRGSTPGQQLETAIWSRP
jgi:serine/threonine protein kinase